MCTSYKRTSLEEPVPIAGNSSVQSLSHVRLFVTPWTAAHQASLSITNSWSLLKLIFVESVISFNHLILCHPPLLLPSIFPSIRVFSNESVLRIRWPKYWSFSFSLSPSNEYSGLISFRIDWFDLLAVQGTLKSLLQHHSSSKNTGVGCQALLQEIFPTQGSNPGLLHCRWILYHLSHQGNLQAFSLLRVYHCVPSFLRFSALCFPVNVLVLCLLSHPSRSSPSSPDPCVIIPKPSLLS